MIGWEQPQSNLGSDDEVASFVGLLLSWLAKRHRHAASPTLQSTRPHCQDRPQLTMDDFATGGTASSRRRREHRDVGSNAFATMRRTASNRSSNSSDILVAAAVQSPPHRTNTAGDYHPHSLSKDSVRSSTIATVANGRHLTVRFGPALARDRFRSIFRTKPKPLSRASNISPFASVKADDGGLGEGPNHRGTYSKEYTLSHPEVDWIHRGQGRYLPVSKLKADSPAASPRPTR